MSLILDSQGRPYPDERPRGPNNLINITGIQQPAQQWAEASREITPVQTFSILREAASGDADAYLTLAIDMEEKYLHYASVLQTRRNGVAGADISVDAADDSDEAQRIADQFQELVVEKENFYGLLVDLLDALSKGYSVVQPYWDTTNPVWTFAEFEHLDPRFFCYDRPTLSELRIKDPTKGQDGRKIPAGQYIIHTPKLRTGIPIRAGLARPAAVGYLFHSATVRQWAAFAEVFGMPLRLGKYDPEVHKEPDIAKLMTVVRNIGHDAAAVIPVGMEIEFPDGRRPTSGDNIFEGLADYWDKAVSKLVLGQTMTSDSGSSRAQSQTHDDVRADFKKADARQASATIYRDVSCPWTLYNFGPEKIALAPRIRFEVEQKTNILELSQAIAPLLKEGLRVKSQELREVLGFSEPGEDDECVGVDLVAKAEAEAEERELARKQPAGPAAGGSLPAKKKSAKLAQ